MAKDKGQSIQWHKTKDSQYNGIRQRTKRAHNDQHNITQKTED
jgi:hypothetical protein